MCLFRELGILFNSYFIQFNLKFQIFENDRYDPEVDTDRFYPIIVLNSPQEVIHLQLLFPTTTCNEQSSGFRIMRQNFAELSYDML
ncbi:hypothetical protein BpHYR1_021387 [Brachionus plicatilis]|uniref:Uncharacterized protein n=1 Tax=Brachionus plicatilis TaxID=10195 RepID=A0A3M7PJ82_BRAPC|nr:hypothetical protein BpHYR1_021387 [Brachionus plicatilis]